MGTSFHGRSALSRKRRQHRQGERGAALVELAVVLPMLALLLVGTLDFGRAFRAAMVVTAAARAGALYGAQSIPKSGDTAGINSAITTVLSSNTMSTGPSATVATLCECAGDTGAFTATTPPNSCLPTACTSPAHLVARVSVTVTRTFTAPNSFPGLPSSVTITRTSIQRVR